MTNLPLMKTKQMSVTPKPFPEQKNETEEYKERMSFSEVQENKVFWLGFEIM